MVKSRNTRTTWSSLLLAASLALTACSGSEANKVTAGGGGGSGFSDDAVVVTAGETEAILEVGQQLVIDFGTYNSSIGDEFELTTEPDARILADFEEVSTYLGKDDEDGASSKLHFTGTAVATGETEVVIEYFYRGDESDNRPDTHLSVQVVAP